MNDERQPHISIDVLEERIIHRYDIIMQSLAGVNSRLDQINGRLGKAEDKVELLHGLHAAHSLEPGHAQELKRLNDQEIKLTQHEDTLRVIREQGLVDTGYKQGRDGAISWIDKLILRVVLPLGMAAATLYLSRILT